jgi:hypothetical protein
MVPLKSGIQLPLSPNFSQLIPQLGCAPLWSQNSQPLSVGPNVLYIAIKGYIKHFLLMTIL